LALANNALPCLGCQRRHQQPARIRQYITDLQERSEAARGWADNRRDALLKAKTGFVSETVFSHGSKLALLTLA